MTSNVWRFLLGCEVFLLHLRAYNPRGLLEVRQALENVNNVEDLLPIMKVKATDGWQMDVCVHTAIKANDGCCRRRGLCVCFLKQFNSKTRDGFTVNSKVPSMKEPGKEYDGFTITITGDRYLSRWSWHYRHGGDARKLACFSLAALFNPSFLDFRVGNMLFSVETQTTEERTQQYQSEVESIYKDLTAKGKALMLSTELGVRRSHSLQPSLHERKVKLSNRVFQTRKNQNIHGEFVNGNNNLPFTNSFALILYYLLCCSSYKVSTNQRCWHTCIILCSFRMQTQCVTSSCPWCITSVTSCLCPEGQGNRAVCWSIQ